MRRISFRDAGLKYALSPFDSPIVHVDPGETLLIEVEDASSGQIRIAVATQGRGGLDDLVSPMFGRAPSFTLVEVEGNEIKGARVLPNQMISAPSGVGIAITQMLANEGARYLVAGRFGPNASAVAAQFGIQTVMVPPGIRVKDAVTQYVLKSR